MLEETSNDFINLAMTSVHFLTRSILDDLETPVLSLLYGVEWEAGQLMAGQVISATLEDYFQDVRQWLPEYFYNKFVREMLNTIVLSYVMTIRRQNSEGRPPSQFGNQRDAAKQIRADKEAIAAFFSTQIDILMRGGLRGDRETVISQEMLLMDWLERLVICPSQVLSYCRSADITLASAKYRRTNASSKI